MLKPHAPVTRSIPLQWILVVPFVLQIFVAVGIVGYLSFKNGQKAVNELADQLMDKASQQVNEHLNVYLSVPIQLTQMNLNAITTGDLDITDRRLSERYFWRELQAFPNLAYVGYTLTDGTETGAGRWIKGLKGILYQNLPGKNNSADYAADANGNRTKRLQTYEYDPLTDTWYQDVVAAKRLIWTRIYANKTQNVELSDAGSSLQKSEQDVDLNSGQYFVAVAASAPFYDQSKRLLGVVSIDLQLTKISQFLRDLNVSSGGEVFIIGRDGLLVGSSTTHPLFHEQKDEIKRFSAFESPDPLLRTIAQGIQRRQGTPQAANTFQLITTTQKFNLSFNQENQYVQVTPWRDAHGLDWLVIVTVPESDFMAQINANTRTTLFLCLAALGVATLLGVVTAHWITQPILKLNQASKAIAAGKLDHQVPMSSIRELDAVGESFNHMAEQLQTSFNTLEQANAELEDRVTERTQEIQQKNTQLQSTLEELHRTQGQMVQSEKMSALGQMVAGVAHEINNPINFIHGNLSYVDEYTQSLLALVQAYEQYVPDPPKPIQAQLQDIELDFLAEDLPKLLQSMKVGTHRICEIVLSLRNFSRLDEAEFKAVDIHEGIDNTLLLLHHRFKAKADRPEIQIIKNYGVLPLVECYAGQLNQVFMNLLSNAIDALEESSHKHNFDEITANPNQIWIDTSVINQHYIRIVVADNGPGISEKARSHLFDPFFTTKSVGKGTGLGLSISYQIITDKHNGKLWYESAAGQGAKFTIEIPVHQNRYRDSGVD